mmetsp:Transcript_41530/g.65895  ORF Transcript_41530/g.65895 Transcript_41530/m.65895 type:complete len:492 (+) Transcript_41530:60-1535(+)
MVSLQDNSHSSPQATIDDASQNPVLLGSPATAQEPKMNVKNTFLDFAEEKTPANCRNQTCPVFPERDPDDEQDQRLQLEVNVDESQTSPAVAQSSLDRLSPTEPKVLVRNTFIEFEDEKTPSNRRNRTCPVMPQNVDDSEEEVEEVDSDEDVSPIHVDRRAMYRTEELQEQFLKDNSDCYEVQPRNVSARAAAEKSLDDHMIVPQQEPSARGVATSVPSPSSKERVDLEKALGFNCALASEKLMTGIAGSEAPMSTPAFPLGGDFSTSSYADFLAHLAAGMVPTYPSPYTSTALPFPMAVPPSMPLWPASPYALGSANEGFVYPDAPRAAADVEHGASSAAAKARPARRAMRLWIHIYLHMKVPGFDLVPMLIGRQGCKMRRIADATGAKIRIRGRGSGHYEIDGKQEAPTPLMVAVTTEKGDQAAFETAIGMTLAELRGVEDRFKVFCSKQKMTFEGPAFSIGLLTPGAEDMFKEVLAGVPFAAQSVARA